MSLIISLLIAAAAGYVAASLMGLDNSNIIQNCGLGLIGGIAAGILGRVIGLASTNIIGHTIFAVIGACIVVYIYRKIKA